MEKANQKLLLRKKFLNLRSKVPRELQRKVFENVQKSLQSLHESRTLKGHIGLFWPLNGEIDLRGIKRSFDLSFALPACHEGKSLLYHQWRNSPLTKDSFGIPAPINQKILLPSEMSLILVPGISVDQDGYRLGYGGGFFDRLRSNQDWRSVPAMVVLTSNCISLNPLPRENWDIPFDGWISDEGASKIASHTNK